MSYIFQFATPRKIFSWQVQASSALCQAINDAVNDDECENGCSLKTFSVGASALSDRGPLELARWSQPIADNYGLSPAGERAHEELQELMKEAQARKGASSLLDRVLFSYAITDTSGDVLIQNHTILLAPEDAAQKERIAELMKKIISRPVSAMVLASEGAVPSFAEMARSILKELRARDPHHYPRTLLQLGELARASEHYKALEGEVPKAPTAPRPRM